MNLIRHCIIDTKTNKVINIVDYETEQTGIPIGFEDSQPNWICVPSEIGQIDGIYNNGTIINPVQKTDILENK